jgi:hypothetical protein
VASSELQISRLVERLVEKTLAAQMRWEPSPQRDTYQARLGDFLIRLTGPTSGLLMDSAQLTVMRLDGRVIESVGHPFSGAAAAISGQTTMISEATRKELVRLYHMVADRNDEIDELISMMG